MRRVLIILTQSGDASAVQMAALQKEQPDHVVESADLSEPEVDYGVLLEKIFAADSVQVW